MVAFNRNTDEHDVLAVRRPQGASLPIRRVNPATLSGRFSKRGRIRRWRNAGIMAASLDLAFDVIEEAFYGFFGTFGTFLLNSASLLGFTAGLAFGVGLFAAGVGLSIVFASAGIFCAGFWCASFAAARKLATFLTTNGGLLVRFGAVLDRRLAADRCPFASGLQ